MDNTIALDYGSESLKAGYAANVPSEEEPRIVLPSCVEVATSSQGQQQARQVQPVVQHGRIVHFDGLEVLLHHVLYNRLGWVIGEEGNLVLVEPLFTPKQDREQLCQLLFEFFNASGIFIMDAAAGALYAVGKQSGCCADVGHGKVDVATVQDGITHAAGAYRLALAGADLTAYLQQQLGERGATLTPAQLSSLKVQCCKAAASADAYAQLMAAPPEPVAYTLPDGASITVSSEGYSTAEALLAPGLVGREAMGLATAISEAILHAPDTGNKRPIYENVLLCGGGGTIPGLGARLEADLAAAAPPGATPSLARIPEYMPSNTVRWAPWVGAAVLAKVVATTNQFMTRSDYEDFGPAAVHRRCS